MRTNSIVAGKAAAFETILSFLWMPIFTWWILYSCKGLVIDYEGSPLNSPVWTVVLTAVTYKWQGRVTRIRPEGMLWGLCDFLASAIPVVAMFYVALTWAPPFVAYSEKNSLGWWMFDFNAETTLPIVVTVLFFGFQDLRDNHFGPSASKTVADPTTAVVVADALQSAISGLKMGLAPESLQAFKDLNAAIAANTAAIKSS